MSSTLAQHRTVEAANNSMPGWLRWGVIILLQLSCALLLSWRTVDADLWGHIQYGQDWLSTGTLPATATHTFTTPDHPWINHENLFELAVACGHRLFGGQGLMLGKCLLGLLLLNFIGWRLQRQGLSGLSASLCLLPVAAGLAEYWQIRPQLFSFLLFAALIWLFEFSGRDGARLRRLWLAIPLLIVWTNSHGGVLAGICVFAAWVTLTVVHQFLQFRRIPPWMLVEASSLITAAAGTLFVNPYGAALPRWYAVSLSAPRPEVSEWAGLLEGGPAAIIYAVLAALTAVGLLLSSRPRSPVETMLLLIIAAQPLGHIRHLPFFAIAFGFWMPAHLLSVWQRISPPTKQASPPVQGIAAAFLKLELATLTAGMLAAVVMAQGRFGVPRDEYPVNAIEFMHQNSLHGRLVVTFDWAQYALAALAPHTTVSFDGRYDTCYPMQIVDWHFDLLYGPDYKRRYRVPASGPVSQQQALDVGHPNLVLLNRQADRPAVSYLRQHPDWQLIYQDGLACLFQRCTGPAAPASITRPCTTDEMPTGIAAWPAFPDRAGKLAFTTCSADAAPREHQN